jgi:hypothetical protein
MHAINVEAQVMSATTTNDDLEFEVLERKSGIPPKHQLGASRPELISLMVAIGVFLLIVAAFLVESML